MNTQEPIRWGILAPGNIARSFATALGVLPDARLVAVGSRDKERARAFADTFGAARAHSSYEALADDPEVDIVYIASPHSGHCENTLLCLDRGKPVLCEKPIAINATQARTMVARARERGLFLMEAMWTRFLPVMVRVRELLAEGAIGEPAMLSADFGFRATFNPTHRLFDPALGGGALLDVGIYPVAFASMVFGPTESAAGEASICQSGVDDQSAFVLRHTGGKLSVLSCSVCTTTAVEAKIFGSEGNLTVHAPWFRGSKLTLAQAGKTPVVLECPFKSNGYQFQAIEAMRCLREGAVESPLLPHAESVALMETLDHLRSLWGIRYPADSAA